LTGEVLAPRFKMVDDSPATIDPRGDRRRAGNAVGTWGLRWWRGIGGDSCDHLVGGAILA